MVAAYTAITGGSYILARGALSLLKKIEPKNRDNVRTKARHEKAQSARQSRCCKTRSKSVKNEVLIAYVRGNGACSKENKKGGGGIAR